MQWLECWWNVYAYSHVCEICSILAWQCLLFVLGYILCDNWIVKIAVAELHAPATQLKIIGYIGYTYSNNYRSFVSDRVKAWWLQAQSYVRFRFRICMDTSNLWVFCPQINQDSMTDQRDMLAYITCRSAALALYYYVVRTSNTTS